MPNAPKTPTRTFRCPDALWVAARTKAATEDPVLSVTQILLNALEAYVED